MICGLDGATATSTRPHGLGGSVCVTSVHERPPSEVLYNPLPLCASGPSPPERNVQPLRRKSQRPAKSTSGFFESMESPEQPVERLPPLRISDQLLPLSLVI